MGQSEVPYIVAGAGGYHNLHKVATIDGDRIIPPLTRFVDNEEVTLERYVDDRHGFLRIEVADEVVTGKYYSVPRPHESWSAPARLADYFELNWRTKKIS